MTNIAADWLCQRIVEQAQDAIIFADHDGIIRLWNAGAETIFGYRADDAAGQTLDLIIPPKQRARHWEGYRRTMATGDHQIRPRAAEGAGTAPGWLAHLRGVRGCADPR